MSENTPRTESPTEILIKKLASIAGTLDNCLDGTTPPIKYRQSLLKAHFDLENVIDQLRESIND